MPQQYTNPVTFLTVLHLQVGRDVLLPIRWMSPESIMYRRYTIESDCWSFGILLWEVLTYGKQPWFEFSNHEVIQNVTHGKQLHPPDGCPSELVDLMQACWQFSPADRIAISKAHLRLKGLMEKHRTAELQAASTVLPVSPAKSTSSGTSRSTTKGYPVSKSSPVYSEHSSPTRASAVSPEQEYLELSH